MLLKLRQAFCNEHKNAKVNDLQHVFQFPLFHISVAVLPIPTKAPIISLNVMDWRSFVDIDYIALLLSAN